MLGVAQPTLGRHVAALERAAGRRAVYPLADRPDADRGCAVAAHLCRVDAQHGRRARACRLKPGRSVRGSVRVTASDVIGVEVLPPIITRLREHYPELEVELLLTDRVQDIVRREADIAVRMLRPRQELLVARRIGQIELGLYAHKRYLAQRGNTRHRR